MMGKIEVNWMSKLHPRKKKTKGRCLSLSSGYFKTNGFFFWAIISGMKSILGIAFCKFKFFLGQFEEHSGSPQDEVLISELVMQDG